MELDNQTGSLGCAQDGGARTPQTDQCAGKHSHVVNKGRRGGAAGRKGGNNNRVEGHASQKRLDRAVHADTGKDRPARPFAAREGELRVPGQNEGLNQVDQPRRNVAPFKDCSDPGW
eukprot:1641695-Alexandrium_andersonii.AAC.1